MIARHALLLAAVLLAAPAAHAQQANSAYRWQLPRGFPEPLVPADNPMSEAKVELGRRLFFETRLSVTGTYSCASCHEPARAFSDGRAVAVGATGARLTHNAMALVNVAYNSSYGWTTPRVRSLEAQMRRPLFNTHPVELGLTGRETAVVAALRADTSYAAAFSQAFPGDATAVSIENLIRAIAAFERTLLAGDSPFDRYVFGGEHTALSDSAKAGMALFYSARLGCGGCHAGFNFTGTWNERGSPPAVAAVACNGAGSGRHRVPTLRNLTLTAPYMHDGRYASLREVLAHYETVGGRRICADSRLRAFELTLIERSDLLAFLQSLNSRASEHF